MHEAKPRACNNVRQHKLNFGVYLGENHLSKIVGLAWDEGEIRLEVDKVLFVAYPHTVGYFRKFSRTNDFLEFRE